MGMRRDGTMAGECERIRALRSLCALWAARAELSLPRTSCPEFALYDELSQLGRHGDVDLENAGGCATKLAAIPRTGQSECRSPRPSPRGATGAKLFACGGPACWSLHVGACLPFRDPASPHVARLTHLRGVQKQGQQFSFSYQLPIYLILHSFLQPTTYNCFNQPSNLNQKATTTCNLNYRILHLQTWSTSFL